MKLVLIGGKRSEVGSMLSTSLIESTKQVMKCVTNLFIPQPGPLHFVKLGQNVRILTWFSYTFLENCNDILYLSSTIYMVFYSIFFTWSLLRLDGLGRGAGSTVTAHVVNHSALETHFQCVALRALSPGPARAWPPGRWV